MFHRSQTQKFYKNFSDRHVMHPGRRWLYHKAFAVGLVGTCIYFPTSFYLADTMEENGKTFGPYFVVQAIELMPLNVLSRFAGSVAASEYLPPSAHHKLIEYYCKMYDVNLEDAAAPGSSGEEHASIQNFRTLQSFFTRELVKGTRAIDTSASVVSPCDGTLLRCGEIGADNLLVQVKGCTYSINNLLRTQLPVPANSLTLQKVADSSAVAVDLSKKSKRLFFSFHLGPADYHRFHSPVDFEVRESILMPGFLFPVMRSATKWFPMLYVNNERVAVHGPIKSKKGEVSGGPNQRHVGIALVGALNVGSVSLFFDERVHSNLSDPPSYAIHRQYSERVAPMLSKGQPMGMFKMGSSIVMVMDVIADQEIVVKQGDKVQMGQCLVR